MPVIAGLAAGIGFILLFIAFIMPSFPPAIRIMSSAIEIGEKAIALEKRTDVDRNYLSDSEQKIIKIALSDPSVLNVLKQKEGLYIGRIEQKRDLGNECDSGCAQMAIGWIHPESAALLVIVDTEKESVKHWLML